MAWESIGSVSTGYMPHDEAWIFWSLQLTKKYILLVCGEPPPGCKLDVMWHDHELGSYPSLGVWFDYEPPWDFINCCERTLEVFDEAVSWHELKEHLEETELASEEEGDDYDDEDET